MSNDTENDTEPSELQSIADNLINGNLKDAKRGANAYGAHDLARHFIDQCGWSANKARAAACYLKDPDQESFQAYCDAV